MLMMRGDRALTTHRKRSNDREPNGPANGSQSIPLGDKPNVIGDWLPSLTFAFGDFARVSLIEAMKNTESEASSDSEAKVTAIFRELVADRAGRLNASHHNHDSVAIIARALSPCPDDRESPEDRRARDIAFHLSDWASDAAFIVAIQLFPERFTAAEIADGVEDFLIHVPNHVVAAAVLGGHPIDDIFEVGALRGTRDDD
jgi:hypothetical protein